MENLGEKDGIDAMAVNEKADDTRGDKANTSSGDEEATNQTTENTKRKEREESSSEPPTDGEDDAPVQKKKRVMWTSEMHQKFVDAIAQIGHDRAFPKKIVEVMNEPGLTRENVASHLQKYRICLKKSHQEGMDKYGSQENFQQTYLWSSQLTSARNYLSMSSSSNSSNYGIGTSIGASRVRLAPPSYSSFDVSSLRINKENVQNQDNRRTEVNRSFRAYADEDQRNMLSSILNKNPSNTLPDDHARITSTNKSTFPGLRIGSDGKSLLFGRSDRSAIVSSENYSTKRNEFYGQGSSSSLIPSFNVENYFQGPPLPQMPDSNTINNLEEPSLPPLPGFSVESSLPQLETDENDPFTFIPQQGSSYGTNLQTEDINSFSSGYTGTSLEQQNYLETLPWETLLENAEMDMISQSSHATNEAFNHMTASSTTLTPPWYPNSYTASYPLNTNLINQEPSLPPLPSDTPLDFYPDSTILNPIPQVMNEQSLLPSIPLESQWNVNSDASTMGGSNSILDQQSPQLPSFPSDIPWNLDSDLVPQAYNGNFLDEPNIMSPSLSETLEDVIKHLSSDDVDLW